MTTCSTHVLDAARGVPAAGLEVTLATPAGTTLATATTDADGAFRAELAADASFLVVQDARWSCLLVGAWRHDASVPPLVVVGPTRRLAGRVVRSDGGALVGGRVELEQIPEAQHGLDRQCVAERHTEVTVRAETDARVIVVVRRRTEMPRDGQPAAEL